MNFVWIETSQFCATHKRADWQILFIPLLLSLYSSPYTYPSRLRVLSCCFVVGFVAIVIVVAAFYCACQCVCYSTYVQISWKFNLMCIFFLCCSCHSLFSFFHFAIIVNCSREFVQLKRNAKSEMCSKHLIFLMCVEWLYSFVSFCLFAKFIYSFVFNCFSQ